MKHLWFLLFVFLSMSGVSCAATLTLAWDANTDDSPWTYVRIYEKVGTGYNMVSEVSGNLTTAVLTGVAWGSHTYIARAVGVDVTGAQLESPDSNSVVTPMSIKNLKVNK
jgi:hypothetical protein